MVHYILQLLHHLHLCLSHASYPGMHQVLVSCGALDHTDFSRNCFSCVTNAYRFTRLCWHYTPRCIAYSRLLPCRLSVHRPLRRVPGTQSRDQVPLMVQYHLQVKYLQNRKYTGGEVWYGCIEPLEKVGSCHHVAVVAVLVRPHFPVSPPCMYSLKMLPYPFRMIGSWPRTVGRAETFDSWTSENWVKSKWKTRKETFPWKIWSLWSQRYMAMLASGT